MMRQRDKICGVRMTRRAFLFAGGAGLVGAVAACSQGQSDIPVEKPPQEPEEASVSFAPATAAVDIDPASTVLVSVGGGTLETVAMTDSLGTPVLGVMTPDKSAWKPTTGLAYRQNYQLHVTTRDIAGRVRTAHSSFRTVHPDNLTIPSFVTTGGSAISSGRDYGIGMVIVVRFDEPIPDRVAAQQQLSVQTEPRIEGAWNWVDEQHAHWRPKEYYPPGTVVTARADVFGKNLGDGLYGQKNAEVSFTIGPAHLSIADDTTKQISVYIDGELARTMPTSMGRGGTVVEGGTSIHFWTQPGVYTVIDKANPVIMDSSTYGLPVNSRLGYREVVNFATRISNDGIYLHQLDETVPQQGNRNMSAGCLNLNAANAEWFFDMAVTGDVVEVRGTGGPPLQLWQNGDWSVPWDTWIAGTAL